MALFLREEDVARLVGIPEALEAVERGFGEAAAGTAQVIPRARAMLPKGVMHLMGGALLAEGVCGLKTYTATATGVRFLVVLFGAESGELLALIEADLLGRLRTGAASGVATRHMARPDACVLGVYGSGGQAPMQVRAICAVRPIERVLVSARDQDRLQVFCAEMSRQLNLPVEPAPGQRVAEEADVLVTITSSREPVVRGAWLKPGTHINAAGSNWAERREIDTEAVQRSAVVAVDSREQAQKESGDLIIPAQQGHFHWQRAVELADIIGGQAPGRPDGEAITLYKSNGIATQDLALAAEVWRRAHVAGAGTGVDILP